MNSPLTETADLGLPAVFAVRKINVKFYIKVELTF